MTRPEHFQVVVTENMFGDILSDLSGATVGGLGMCPSANIGERPAYFEPIHGTAPDIAGKGIANPIGQIWSGALLLEHLGEKAAADAIFEAINATSAAGIITADLGGKASSREVAASVMENLYAMAK